MTEQRNTENPYRTPKDVNDSQPKLRKRRDYDTRPFWAFTLNTVSWSVLGTPADPLSTVLAMWFGWGVFIAGNLIGSRQAVQRWSGGGLLVTTILLCFAFGFQNVVHWLAVLVYLPSSLSLGWWAARVIRRRRARLLVWFSGGFLLGSIVVVGVFPCVLAANSLAILHARKLDANSELK